MICSLSCRFDDCVEGGENTVVDAYPVVEELRRKHPKQFEVLTRVPYFLHRTYEETINDEYVSLYIKCLEPLCNYKLHLYS